MIFQVWAPAAATVVLQLAGERRPMDRDPGRSGWWRTVAEARSGVRYGYVLDDGPVRPDPRGLRLPDGTTGLSAVVDHDDYEWHHPWQGRELTDAVLYELHVGTFTPGGTFATAAHRLEHLAALGVTHVQLMPVCPFPGTYGWGYDGVAPWAVHEPYGGPSGLKLLVDAAHGLGLGVVLDVVHNHLGPAGNQLPAFGPYFTDRHTTPWGSAVNLDGAGSAEVRAYFIGSALAFLRDYRLDGLRLDAVHTLFDDGPRHYLSELSAEVDELAGELGRPLFLIAESDQNDPRLTTPRQHGGMGVHAQWNDDFHHALHAALTGESHGYYADFASAPLAALARTLTDGFFYQGGHCSFRGRAHGAALDREHTRPGRLLGYVQNHDQVGNRAGGDRLTPALDTELAACAAALVICGPFTPMLFMGEEWGATTAWQYFTDHQDPRLAEAVRIGRQEEYAVAGMPTDLVPDPQDPATRQRSVLDWSEPERSAHASLLDWYRGLLAIRRDWMPRTLPLAATRVAYEEDEGWLTLCHGPLLVAVNLGRRHVTPPLPQDAELLAATHPFVASELQPRSAVVLGLTPEARQNYGS